VRRYDVMEIRSAYRSSDTARQQIAVVAAAQKGVITILQLRALGFSSQTIARLRAKGHLHRIHTGVYAVGHTALTLHGRWLAAVLACGQDAVLSHHAAAALHELRTNPSGLIDVTAPGKRAHDGVRCHTTRSLPASEKTAIDAIPVTTLARTFVDYAETATKRHLNQALAAAERADKLNFLRLEATINAHPGRHGAKALASALEAFTPEDPRTRSKLEQRFLRLVRRAGIPEPQCNVYVDDLLVDFYWPDAELVIEVDSFAHHRGKRQFEEDRRRDAIHTVAGRRTLRPTDRRIQREAESLLKDVSRLLDGARGTGHSPAIGSVRPDESGARRRGRSDSGSGSAPRA
jgi:very-short-patch-repair endonuclease